MSERCQCKLCHKYFEESEMSEEHYPAHSVGNDDIIALNLVKMFDSFQSREVHEEILRAVEKGASFEEAAGKYFDRELAVPLYPKGRTARTLCRECNTFLGKYDEAYLRFFNVDGNPKSVKGFQTVTKIQIIKSIFAKFLSVPETENEEFDFLNFIKDTSALTYTGLWSIYFVHRDYSSDLMGLADIGTGVAHFEEGVVYEFSDEKFIFNLMNFKKHEEFEMNNIFDIMDRNYKLIMGVGRDGGYHAQIYMGRLFSQMFDEASEAGIV